jgi:FtsP/CotA-like multicopper oxidase with cupredoxin domain
MGMYGALIVADTEKPSWDREFVAMVDEWDTHRDPADAAQMPQYDYFVVNGKAGHSVPDMIIPEGEIARVRLINAGFATHSLHLHGTHFVITHKDGYQLPLPQRADTLNIAPGETYDVLIKGRDGVFPWHDHNSLAVTNAGVYPGGMLMHTRGSAARRFDPSQQYTALPIEGEIHNQSHRHGDEGLVIDHGAAMPVPHNPEAPRVTANAVTPETTFGQAVAFNPFAPAQPPKGKVVDVTLEARRVKMEVAAGDVREVWTFGGQVPAPTIRVHQGDTIRVTLINKDPEMEHGLDFHAGQMDSGTFHKPIKPGESETFAFQANYPGVFYCHCSTGPVIMHIANGMFGAVIVDPPGYQPAGTEYVLIQNEWYNPAGGLDAVLNGQPTAVALNGVAAQYVSQPLTARAGETVRFYFVNAGVSNFAGFHVIGEIFDHVYPDGNPKNSKQGVQTVTVPPGGAVVADLVAEPGSYPILTHSLGDATQGALGILQVHATDGVTVLYDGQVLTHSAREMDGKTYVSAAEFARLAGVDYEYDAASGRLTVAGKALPADAVMPDGHGGAPYAWIRSLADAVGAKVEWNSATRTVVVTPTGE